MNQAIVFKKSVSVALVMALQTALPPIVATGCLFGSAWAYGFGFDQAYQTMSVVVVGLTFAIVRPLRDLSSKFSLQRWPLIVSLMARWLILLCAILFVGYITKYAGYFPRRVLLSWALITPAILTLSFLAVFEFTRKLLLDQENLRTVVIAGYNEVSQLLHERLRANPELGLAMTGFFDDRSPERLDVSEKTVMLGPLSRLAAHVNSHHIDVIFIALPVRQVARVVQLLDDLRDTTASIYFVPDIFVTDLIQSRTGEIGGIPVISMCETPFFGMRGVIKRVTDITLSVSALALLAPILLAVALVVKFSSKGPAIFRQRRYGLDGHPIVVYKFRSMRVVEDGDRVIQATKEDARITPIGRFLRRYSLDELPQLLNVLQGRMSLVGPRPHAVAHNEEYRRLIKGYMVRHKVLPGMTGLAQINGCRGETARLDEMEARVNFDLEYLRHWSLALDFKILALTIPKMLRDERAY